MELSQRGANIRAVNDKRELALHLLVADINGYSEDKKRETLYLFVSECFDFFKKRNSAGFTPFQLAAQRRCEWSWEVLLSADADPLMSLPEGKTALHKVVAIYDDNWFKWVKIIVEMGGNINSRDGSGETPIFTWARNARAIFEENEEETGGEFIHSAAR